ncbi:hypothetical protein DUI87_09525 [Hirundo rustica rustica]|uniref:RING-type domain-containing protein n=1 Tax=Hirundo rustica rustica TaxID=333673 RepID=A0A3M0KMF9_HIRRU|nr:hypothetical protein DUI87_09525 [Hirundo rustica rustica]
MESPAVTFTLAYLVFAVCFVFPPDEVRSAGLTVQSLLSAWLGSEDAAFVQYHLRRSTGTLLAHSLLPLQQDIHLTVTDSRQHELTPDSNVPVQFLTIRVASVNPYVKAFDIRLNSTEYGELREKLRAPISNAANVVIHQSLSDLFLETFTSLVEINQTYHVPSTQELEPCIGCMQTIANIKLIKNCQEPNEGECQQCYCRPMWCLTCMGKWFASRQDQQHPETWLSSQVPCPTCRAKFCILDVCLIR